MDAKELEKLAAIEAMKKQALSRMLTKEAYERLGRVRAVNPQVAAQAELYLLQIQQSGKLTQPITDEKLKEILRILTEKKDIKIKRK